MIEATHNPPLTPDRLQDLNERARPCLHAYNLRRVRMWLSPDGSRTLCEIVATDADTVRMACRQAGVPFDRIWTADILEPIPGVTTAIAN